MRKGESKLARDLYNKSDKNQKSGREQIRLIRERKKENLNEKKKKNLCVQPFLHRNSTKSELAQSRMRIPTRQSRQVGGRVADNSRTIQK